ncbi:MAG: hypothetical protein R2942_08080 [Ignavibacteria bacterium]
MGNYNIAVVAAGNGAGLNVTEMIFQHQEQITIRNISVYVQGVDGANVSNVTSWQILMVPLLKTIREYGLPQEQQTVLLMKKYIHDL